MSGLPARIAGALLGKTCHRCLTVEMNGSDTQNDDGRSTADFWSAVQADKAEFRSRVARAAESGEDARAFHESVSLLGIDANRRERHKLLAISGARRVRR